MHSATITLCLEEKLAEHNFFDAHVVSEMMKLISVASGCPKQYTMTQTIDEINSWFAPLQNGGLNSREILAKARERGVTLDYREHLTSVKSKLIAQIGVLPNWQSEQWKDCLVKLQNYRPTKVDECELLRQLKILMDLVPAAVDLESKAFFCSYIFHLLAVNVWFIQLYPKFGQTVKNKLVEFAGSEQAKAARDIATKFDWMCFL